MRKLGALFIQNSQNIVRKSNKYFSYIITTGCLQKNGTPHKWYLSVYIYAILYIGWYCRIGNAILHNYIKFYYQNRRGYFKIRVLLIDLHRFWLKYDSQRNTIA